MVRSEADPTDTDVIAAFDAVAKPKANTAPRTIVLIINHSLIFRISHARSPFRRTADGKLASNMTKTMTEQIGSRRIHLDERIAVRCKTAMTQPVCWSSSSARISPPTRIIYCMDQYI